VDSAPAASKPLPTPRSEGTALAMSANHVKDGKVTEQRLHPGDPYASDEFWG
jgi:hypothetical protein